MTDGGARNSGTSPGDPAPWYLAGGAAGPPQAPAGPAPAAWTPTPPASPPQPPPAPMPPLALPQQHPTAEQPYWGAAPHQSQPAPAGPVVGPRRSTGLSPAVWIGIAALAVVLLIGGVLAFTGLSADSTSAGSGKERSSVPADQDPALSGPVGPLQPISVTASCQAPPGVDAAGNPITYEPELVLDGIDATAWRCPGSAVGEKLVFDFGTTVTLTSVALIPGYAKVDPADGTNRFAENRTVTSVAWVVDDGSGELQRIPTPQATLAWFDLPAPVRTTRVVLDIAGTGNDAAKRDFTAISEVRFTGS